MFSGEPTVEETTANETTTEEASGSEVTELVPSTDSTSQPLVVEVVETPIDQLEQTLIDAQEANDSETNDPEANVLTVVTLDEPDATETVETETSQSSATTDATTNTTNSADTSTASTSTTETASEAETSSSSVSDFSTRPIQAARAEDPDVIIIEYTNVDSIQEDASLDTFFGAGPHALLAMRDEDEMLGIATLAPDGTLSLRTADVLERSRPADESFAGCLDVIREHPTGAAVFGGISYFESISVPGLILTPVLDINGDSSYIPPVNYVRLTDPLLVSGTCFELETAVESVQASFVPGWNRLLREIDWRDIARGNTAAQDSEIQKTLWSVNNNSETVVKWLYSRP